jgi:hypothetical protein
MSRCVEAGREPATGAVTTGAWVVTGAGVVTGDRVVVGALAVAGAFVVVGPAVVVGACVVVGAAGVVVTGAVVVVGRRARGANADHQPTDLIEAAGSGAGDPWWESAHWPPVTASTAATPNPAMRRRAWIVMLGPSAARGAV